tara:strand:+ start:39 stop:185 length:147 start_codon:yes stop_codon:yes gene_type:complete
MLDLMVDKGNREQVQIIIPAAVVAEQLQTVKHPPVIHQVEEMEDTGSR